MRRIIALGLLMALLLSCTAVRGEDAPLSALTTLYTLDMMEADLKQVAASENGLATLEEIGRSVEDRPLYALTVGHGDTYVLIMAGVHANEIANPPMVVQAAADILTRFDDGDPEMAELVNDYTIVIVPCVNPDGYANAIALRESGTISKKKGNAHQVNLNRNFPSPYWGSSRKPGDYDYPGESAGSEPETQAMVRLMARYPFKAGLDVHSQGRLVYYGKGGFLQEDVNSPLDVKVLDARGKTLAQALKPKNYSLTWQSPASKKTKYGSTTDYLFALGVPGITIETMTRDTVTVKRIAAEYARLSWPDMLLRFCRAAGEFT